MSKDKDVNERFFELDFQRFLKLRIERLMLCVIEMGENVCVHDCVVWSGATGQGQTFLSNNITNLYAST